MYVTELPVDYDEIVHYDARHGYEKSLELYLKHKPECLNKLYEYGESKWTVLLAACYYQHEAIVRMLVTQFQPDIEAEGTIIVNDIEDGSPTIVEGASPLWAAAAVNNFNIVKFLVLYGLANVNHLTKEYSSPIRAACYSGNLEMVKFLVQYGANPHQMKLNNNSNLLLATYHGYLHLVTYFVDMIKCDINQQNSDCETALYVAVDRNSFRIIEFLLSRGALNLRNQLNNLTPLMSAAIHGNTSIVTAFDGHCTNIEWIEAKELLGSAFAGCKPYHEDMDLAVTHLTDAFETRTTKNIPKHHCVPALEVFNNHRECQTLEEFNQLVSSESRENLYFEVLLIQERILGTSSDIYHDSLREIGYTFAQRNEHDVCLRLWFYELDLRKQHGIALTQQNLDFFAWLFDNMLLFDKAQMFIKELCKVLTIISDRLSSKQDNENFNSSLITLLHLITVSAHLLLRENTEEDNKRSMEDGKNLFKLIQSIVNKKYVTVQSGSSLLHLCCDENTEGLENIVRYPCITTVRLLVFCGIDIDAMDSAKNTALHLVIHNGTDDNVMNIIDFLSNSAGAHLDFADINGNSPMEYSDDIPSHVQTRMRRLQQKRGVISLKCRCARLVKYGRLQYQECLSSALINFVYKH